MLACLATIQLENNLMSTNTSEPRVKPRQTRAQKRIDDILAATENILENGGEVTTSTVAKTASIPVGSIYRYFPNVFGIYRNLFEKLNGELLTRIEKIITEADETTHWREAFQDITAAFMDIYTAHPAYGELLVMMTNPALRSIKKASNKKIADMLAQRWRDGQDGFTGDNANDVANTAVELFSYVELCFFEHMNEPDNSHYFTEPMKALEAYLSLYLQE